MTVHGECGAIYQMYVPRVNACRPALQWQTYDIYFRTTPGGIAEDITAVGPLLLQDHGAPISYRNIWIEEL